MKVALRAVAGLAFGLAVSLPAQAQFFAPYAPVIEVPPPAPYVTPQKHAPMPSAPQKAAPPAPAAPQDLSRCYQGRVRIC